MGVWGEVGGQIGQKLQKNSIFRIFFVFFRKLKIFDIFISRYYRRVSIVHKANKIIKICRIDSEKINF